MAKKNEAIRIIGVEVENFHRIRAAHIELRPEAGLVRVTGKNRAGKTSLLRAVAAALGGQGEVLPASVHLGSEDGTGRVTLRLENGYSVERRFTESNPKGYLTVVGPDGGKHSQTKLGEWLGERSFHPLALFNLRPAELRRVFLSLGTDPDLGQKLDALKAEQVRVSEERKPWNSAKQRAERTPMPDGERPEPVDVSGEMARLRELREHDRQRSASLENARRLTKVSAEAAETVESQLEHIADLEQQLESARAILPRLQEAAKEAAKASDTARRAWDVTTDPSDEIAAVEARISEADAVNAALEPWREYDRAVREGKEAAKKADELTHELNSLRARESALLAQVGIPVPGLSFDDDGTPLLNGLPLEVASGAEKIEMAVAVAIAANPDLRVCLVDEANDMDMEMLAALDARAKEHGFQVWVCRIGLEGAGEIVVEDGEATTATDAAEAA